MGEHDEEYLQGRTDAQVYEDITGRLLFAAAELARQNGHNPLATSEEAALSQRSAVHSTWDQSAAGSEVVYEFHDKKDINDRYQVVTINGPDERILAILVRAGLIERHKFYRSLRFYINDPSDAAISGLPDVMFSAITFRRALDPDASVLSYKKFEQLSDDGGLYEKVPKRTRKRRARELAQLAFLRDEYPDLGD